MATKHPTDSQTSNTLLLRVRNVSDEQAWSEFVERYAPKIFPGAVVFSYRILTLRT